MKPSRLCPRQTLRSRSGFIEAILDLTEVWWIHGNHDTDSDADYDHLFGSALADRNLHGRVVEVADQPIAGLGGIFRGQVWAPPDKPRYPSKEDYLARCGKGSRWHDGMPRRHRSTIFADDYQALLGEQADILVTHEAPSCHRHGFREIDDLAHRLGAKTAFHGHHHEHIDYAKEAIERIGFTCYGVGYCGIRDQFGTIVLTEIGSK
ncbi:MAG: metallophosphoesterase [Rhodanobacter sp.]